MAFVTPIDLRSGCYSPARPKGPTHHREASMKQDIDADGNGSCQGQTGSTAPEPRALP